MEVNHPIARWIWPDSSEILYIYR